ncbi:MAG: Pr6Pr family membrane protein [Acidobacteriaceae bacterium]
MTTRRILATVRFLFGVFTLLVVGIQLGVHMGHGYSVLNFFSYFTNLSNIFAAAVLIVEATLSWRRRELGPLWQLVRCASVVCMTLVGIVFLALLRDVDLGSLLPWINVWLHYVMPVGVLLDWLALSPSRSIAYGKVAYLVVLPLAYLAYSLIRGVAIGWFAYPFLNPASGGWGAVALTCAVIAVVFVTASFVLVAVANRLRRYGCSLPDHTIAGPWWSAKW